MNDIGGNGTREVPTYFGPAYAPMFGVLHLPVDYRVRGGVLICGSIGKDAADSTITQRLIADDLARRGAAVLRFDYLGCGDSSFEDSRADAVREWQDSIDHAASYLTAAVEVDDLSLIALRAGCLIATAAMQAHASLRSVKRVVFVDPVGTGKRFLREQSTFFKMAAEHAGPVEHDGVSIIGAQLSAEAARELSSLRLSGGHDDVTRPDMFIVTRSDGADPVVSDLIEKERPEVCVSDGLREAAQPTRLLSPEPLNAIDAVVKWLDAQLPRERKACQPELTDRARVPDGAGGHVVEIIERIDPMGLFAIRTTPDGADPAQPLPTVVFFTNAVNPHHGPNRSWVHIARAAASQGHQAFRWDRRGAGESGRPRRGTAVHIYSQEGIDDALAATRHARGVASKLILVGLCSGAWFAAQGARVVGADALALVNVLLWSWRVKGALQQPIAPADNDVADWEQTSRARLRRIMQSHMPFHVWTALGRTGAVQAPENMLAGFAKQGVSVTAILCPSDAKLFFANRGGEALDRLQHAAAPPRLVETTGGDHAAFQPVVLGPLAHCILETLAGFESPVGSR